MGIEFLNLFGLSLCFGKRGLGQGLDIRDDGHRVLVDAGVPGQELLVHQVEHHAGLRFSVDAHLEPEQNRDTCSQKRF